MSFYELLLFVHIAAAIVWVGGGTMMQFVAFRALRADDQDRVADVSADIEWIGTRLLVPTSLLAFLSGLGLVWESSAIGFGDDWIVIALVLFAVTFLAGAAFFGPEAGRISKLVARQGAGAPAAQSRIRRLLILSRVDLVVLYLLVFDMAAKPSFDDGWTIVWALVAAVALSLLLTVRRGAAPETVAATD